MTFTPKYQVNVSITQGTINVTGIVSSTAPFNPTINCTSSCSASYTKDTNITLVAIPSTAVTWSGCTPGANGCTISKIGADTNVSAAFPYRLDVTNSTNNNINSTPAGISNCKSGAGTCTGMFAQGASVTLSANQAMTWTIGTLPLATNTKNPPAFTMDADKQVTATP